MIHLPAIKKARTDIGGAFSWDSTRQPFRPIPSRDLGQRLRDFPLSVETALFGGTYSNIKISTIYEKVNTC